MTIVPRAARRFQRRTLCAGHWRWSAAACAAALAAVAGGALADDTWTPFPEPELRRAPRGRDAQPPVSPPAAQDQRPFLAPMSGPAVDAARRRGDAAGGATPGDTLPSGARLPSRSVDVSPLPPLDEKSRAVETVELAPVVAGDGSGLPYELWRGLDVAGVERLIASLEIPPRSPALASLWRRLVTADVTPPAGGAAGHVAFDALRAEALLRSGLATEAGAVVAKLPGGANEPLAAVLTARTEIALGRRETACEAARSVTGATTLPKHLKLDAILIGGYCSAAAGNAAAAGLAATLAREIGAEQSHATTLSALDALASGGKPEFGAALRLSSLDLRIAELAGTVDARMITEKGSAAVAAALALDERTSLELRLAAAETATRRNALSPSDLARIYRAHPTTDGADTLLAAGTETTPRADTPARRAQLLKAAENERTPLRKVRLIRAFLDDARRGGLYLAALEIAEPAAAAVSPVAEIGWFAETAIETALAAGRFDTVRPWVELARNTDRAVAGGGPGPLDHWLALAEIADPRAARQRGASLAAVESMAVRGRLGTDLLHRLATVLDALEFDVPIPLWETASRTPQPSTGHLPETGVLSELLEASKRKEFGHTVLVAMRALGPDGAEGAHMIALGDSIRALRRAGLDSDARRMGFEALFAAWPRSVTN